MLLQFFESLFQIFAAFAFGYATTLGELLDRRGYRWFRGAPLAVGAAAGALGLAMLWISMDGVRIFWLAALASSLLLGRMFVPGKLVTSALLGAYLVWWSVTVDNFDVRTLVYFSVTLLLAGGAQEAARRLERTPAWLALALGKEQFAHYAIVVVYLLVFELDLGLAVAIWAFHNGREVLMDEGKRAGLRSWGVKPPALR